MESDNNNTQIVCRFCLQYSARMWPLETIHNREKSFLQKVYQCTQINIIDLNELHTWVCESCFESIEKFYAFRHMLQVNLTDFNERFRAEQKELRSESDLDDNQQVEIDYYDFSDVDDCYEIQPTDSEYDWTDTDAELMAKNHQRRNESKSKGSYQVAEIEAEFTETSSEEECMDSEGDYSHQHAFPMRGKMGSSKSVKLR